MGFQGKEINYMKYGVFGTYLLSSRLQDFGELPAIPHDYTLWAVNNDKDVKIVTDFIKQNTITIIKIGIILVKNC